MTSELEFDIFTATARLLAHSEPDGYRLTIKRDGRELDMQFAPEDLAELASELARVLDEKREAEPKVATPQPSFPELCPICGSDDIQVMRWVDQRTGEVQDDCGDGCWCNACGRADRDQEGGSGTMGYQRPVALSDVEAGAVPDPRKAEAIS